jgi:hypothetical protein
MVSFSEDSIRAIRGPGGVILKTLKKAVAVSDASIFLRTLPSRGNLQASLTYPHRHDRLGQVASKQPLCLDTFPSASRDRWKTATAHLQHTTDACPGPPEIKLLAMPSQAV